ncbi:MAG: rod shape-determining protein MreC [Dehalococcoidia bacterium]
MAMSGRVVVWLVATTVIGAIVILLSQQRTLDPLQNAALSLTSPAQSALRQAADSVSGFFDRQGGEGDLEAQVQGLRRENQRLTAELARLREELATTQALLELQQVVQERPGDKFLLANIIAKDPDDLREAVAIDRGRKDGVAEGMVVVAEGEALVGTVTRALEDVAWITLVTDPNSSINALVQSPDAKGVVSGRLGSRPLLELIPQAAVVNPGDLVVTSGLGGTFPKALVIGRVITVEGEPQDAFKQATVEPAAPVGELETVLVLTSFRPPRLQRP